MPFFYIDIYYIILVVPALIFAIIAQTLVHSRLNSFSRIPNSKRITGRDAAERMLYSFNINYVNIEPVHGNFNDHFDPSANSIRLSDSVYSGSSITSVCVACHEAGHAVQYATDYAPIGFKKALIPIARIGSTFSVPLIIIGFFLPVKYDFVVNIGIILYTICVLLTVITLPIEFNASKRALAFITQNGLLDNVEIRGAKKVLSAAALTYVAAMLSALMNLLRIVLIAGNRRRR